MSARAAVLGRVRTRRRRRKPPPPILILALFGICSSTLFLAHAVMILAAGNAEAWTYASLGVQPAAICFWWPIVRYEWRRWRDGD